MAEPSTEVKNLSISVFFGSLWEVEFELDRIKSTKCQISTVVTIPVNSRTKALTIFAI